MSDAVSRYFLPFPLASLFSKARNAHDPAARYGFSLKLAEGIARFLGYVGLADAVSQGAGEGQIREWLKQVEQASFGKLCALAKSTSLWLAEGRRPLIPEIGALWDGEWARALQEAVNLRNRFAHDDLALHPAEALAQLEALDPHLSRIVEGIDFLSRYHLGFLAGCKQGASGFQSYWYPSTGLEEAGQYQRVSSKQAPRDEQLVLFTEGFSRGLYLGPLLRWVASGKDQTERIFWLQRTENGIARYGHPVLRHEPHDTFSGGDTRSTLPPTAAWPGTCDLGLDDKSRSSMSKQTLPTVPHNRYSIVGKIGEGAMGTVYEVYDTRLDQRRAMKVIRPELLQSPNALRRFEREAKLLAGLSAPELVRVHDLELHAEPPFLIMDLVNGEDLGAFLERNGPVAPQRAVEIILGLCRALTAVHAAGVVHRDVKPSNVMLTPRGPRLLDFGIALPRQGTRYTAGAHQPGTPAYMAPEQMEGQWSAAVDQFAAGKVLAALLLGRSPLMIEALDTTLSSAPRSLRDVVLRATAPAPENRYPSAEAFAQAAIASLKVAPSGATAGSALASSQLLAPRQPAQIFAGGAPEVRDWGKVELTLRPKDEQQKAVMRAFGSLWHRTREGATTLGWSASIGAYVELYLASHPRSAAQTIFISPAKAERFLLRVTPVPGFAAQITVSLSTAISRSAVPASISLAQPKRAAGPVDVIDVTSTWRDVMGSEPERLIDAVVATRLAAFVMPLIRAIPLR